MQAPNYLCNLALMSSIRLPLLSSSTATLSSSSTSGGAATKRLRLTAATDGPAEAACVALKYSEISLDLGGGAGLACSSLEGVRVRRGGGVLKLGVVARGLVRTGVDTEDGLVSGGVVNLLLPEGLWKYELCRADGEDEEGV